MDEYYELYIGTFLGDFSYGDIQYASQEDAFDDVEQVLEEFGPDTPWQIIRYTKDIVKQSEGLGPL